MLIHDDMTKRVKIDAARCDHCKKDITSRIFLVDTQIRYTEVGKYDDQVVNSETADEIPLDLCPRCYDALRKVLETGIPSTEGI